jgi:DNA-binding transcriptional regulator GbsR (MarR family)
VDRDECKHFIEQTADLMDQHGLPHMAGRIVGALLVCQPPYMSHDELAESVQASKGAISMATQMLLRMNLVERISLPGERRHYYRLRGNFLEDAMQTRTEHVLLHKRLYEAGTHLLRDEPLEANRRLTEMQAYVDFFAEELPGLSKRWSNRREELIRRRMDALEKAKETT